MKTSQTQLLGVDHCGGRGYQLVSCSRCAGDLYIGRDSEEGVCGQCVTRLCPRPELEQPQPKELSSFSGDRERFCPACGETIPVSRVICPHCKGTVYRSGGRPKKMGVNSRTIDFSGLEAAVESGNGKLRGWRESQGLSQSDTASILEITKRQYQRIEETGKISSRILGKIRDLSKADAKVSDPRFSKNEHRPSAG